MNKYLLHVPAIIIPIAIIVSFAVSLNVSEYLFIEDVNYILIWFFAILPVFFMIMFFRKGTSLINLNIIDIAVFIFYTYVLIRKLYTPDHFYDYYFILLSTCVFCYYIVKVYYKSQLAKTINLDYFFFIFITITLIELIHGLLQVTGLISDIKCTPFNLGGTFLNPGVYANFIVVLLPFSLTGLLFSGNKYLKYYSFIVLVFTIIMLVLSHARAAWIAGIVIFILTLDKKFFLFKRFKNSSQIHKIVLCCLAGLCLIFGIYFLYQFKYESANGRIFIWQNSLHLVREKPLFGNGFNLFYKKYNDYQSAYFMENKNSGYLMQAGDVKYAFNDLLEIIVNIGITGLLVFISIIVLALTARSKQSNEKTENNIFLYTAKLSLLAIIVSGFFSYPLRVNAILTLFFFNLAVISAFNANTKITIRFSNYLKKGLALVVVISFIFIEYHHIRIFKALKRWNHAAEISMTGNVNEVNMLYEKVKGILNHNYFFLQNYGDLLHLQGKFEKSIDYLQKSAEKLSNNDIYMALGDCYQGLGDLEKAESCYIKASCFIPHLISPKYSLFTLYRRQNNVSKAMDIACEIQEQEIKIYSEDAGRMKSEVLKYINENCKQIK